MIGQKVRLVSNTPTPSNLETWGKTVSSCQHLKSYQQQKRLGQEYVRLFVQSLHRQRID